MQVGETVRLSIEFVGCGFAADEVYITTNPTVGVLEPIEFGAAVLRALTPGELSVFAEFLGPDGVRHRTTTADCHCSNPRKIGIIRVVP